MTVTAAGTGRRRIRGADLATLAVLVAAFALPLRGMLRSQGPPMEEGFMLVFPERFLAGDVPNRDFLHLYGPGSVWVLAGWYRLLGVTLWSERLFGLLQQIGVVVGVWGIARFWNRALATWCALVSVMLVVPPLGLVALAWTGGVALGICGLAAVLQARRLGDGRRARRWAVLGGIALGAALLYRLDLVVAVGLGAAAALWGAPSALRRRVLVAGGATGALYLVHLVMAGPLTVFRGMVLDPVVYLRGGRRLPVPPPWDRLDGYLQIVGTTKRYRWALPSPDVPAQLTLWFFLLLASVAVLVGVGIWAVRAEPGRLHSRVLLAAALFSLGLVPQAVQRADSTHLAWVSCVPMALLPVGIVELTRRLRPGADPLRASWAAGAAVGALFLLVLPHYTVATWTDFVFQTFGRQRQAFEIRRGNRVFYYGRSDVADANNALLAEVPRFVRRGQRLIVAPLDMRKTPYSDAHLYYLLPELRPGTYYIEMDPGVANAPDSRLAGEVARADVVILSDVWSNWDEPNDSRRVGPDRPNRVLRARHCRVRTYGDGLYEVWLRRRPGERCAAVRARVDARLAARPG